jgi:hypothetical protein
MTGIITLAVLAVLVSWVVSRVMRRLRIGSPRTLNAGVIVVFVLAVLLIWTQSNR